MDIVKHFSQLVPSRTMSEVEGESERSRGD